MSRFSVRISAQLVAMLATLGTAIAAESPTALTVTFIHPETYQDASRHYGYGSDPQVLNAIRQHLQKLAARRINQLDRNRFRGLFGACLPRHVTNLPP